MLVHTSPLFQIYFGNADDALFPADYLNLLQDKKILEQEPYNKLKKLMQLKKLLLLHQVHGIDGFIIGSQEAETLKPFSRDGDYLITDLNHVGLGVMTADCLPIIFHDVMHNAIAIIHAGWRGAVKGIAVKAFEQMEQVYGTQKDSLRIYFGPCAKVCCYQIQENFLENLESVDYTDRVIQTHGDDLYFDLPEFNRLQLENVGIKKEAFHLEYNICTMCDTNFYSYRRQGASAGRQMTVVSLK